MSWETLDQVATDEALHYRVRNPTPPAAPKASTWGQAAELIAAPFKGLAQGGMQTARVFNRAAATQVGNPLAMTAAEQEEVAAAGGITREGMDRELRKGVERFNPDPLTATTASLVLQDVSRLIGKATGYSLIGGPAGAIAGTGLDEAATGFMELRDKGVDAATATKAGAVRGVSTAVGIALPVAGKTVAKTMGLAVAGGPASFIAEQVATRAILEEANYPELAREHDPFDPVGLGVSIIFPGVVGAAVHRARARRAAALPPGVADDIEVRDAAHTAYQAEQINTQHLSDPADPQARASHQQALQAAARALDEGAPVQIADLVVDPARAQPVHDALVRQLPPMAETLSQYAQRAGDEIGGVSHLKGIVTSLQKTYIEQGPDFGRARLEDMAAGAPEYSNFSNEVATKGFIDELDAELASRAALFKQLTDPMPVLDRPTSRRDPVAVHELAAFMREAVEARPNLGQADQAALEQNLLAAEQWVPGRVPEVMETYRQLAADRPNQPPHDLLADAIEQVHGTAPEAAPQTPMDRAMKLAQDAPDLLVRAEDDGAPPERAADLLQNVQDWTRGDKTDAKAFDAAVECFLKLGGT